MARRKITVGDWLRGAGRSVMSGTSMNPFTTQRMVNEAHDERVMRQRVERLGTFATDAALGAAYREGKAQKGRDVQFKSNGITVKVKNGFSRDYNDFTTDIILIDPGRPGEHLHYVLNSAGIEIHKKWTSDHR